jgi:hypothetical protein
VLAGDYDSKKAGIKLAVLLASGVTSINENYFTH